MAAQPTPPPNGPPALVDPGTFARIRDVVLYVEGMVRNKAPAGPGRRVTGRALAKAKTGTGGIPAGNTDGSAPGSATVTFADWDDTTGAWSVGSDTATAYNPGTAAVGGGKFVTLGWVGGVWEVVVESC